MMITFGKDLSLEIARGKIPGISHVNKYGRAIDGVQTIPTDIWDRADSTPTQPIWLAPTAARIHTIVSAHVNDVTGEGTLTLTGQPADTQTCTTGTKVYTFQTVLTNVDGNVLIGANASATIDNLIAAINLAAGSGTTYAALTTAGEEDVEAAAGAGDTMTLWDHTSSAIATTDTMDNASWGAANTINGPGAVAVEVHYLPDWDTPEAVETIYMHGTVGVEMSSAAVIIHRMKIIANGTAYGINVGAITATAAVDATITAQVDAGEGQTGMAVYGIPSIQTAYMTGYMIGSHDSVNPGTPVEVDFNLLVNEHPDVNPAVFINKSNLGIITTGDSAETRNYNPYKIIPGPAIIKFQGTATANDTEGTAEFDLILVDN